MDYLTLKSIHVGAVITSYLLFFVRGIWMMRKPAMLRVPWVRIVPHAVDSVLLASAITLVVLSRQYPLEAQWLTAKLIGLVIYIALGMAALGRARSYRMRVAAWVAAQVVFFYIVAVAITHDPLPYAGLLRMDVR
ncbi:MAG: SirB2 family protein [Burkholderiales bacterium]